MSLRNQLKNVKIQHSETIHSYFRRVSHIKEQLEAIEENVEEGEIVMSSLNGLPRSWDWFIQGIFTKKKLIKFNRLWEECTQEQARLVSREEKMGASDDQSLTAHAKKNEGKREDHSHKRTKKFQKNHRSRRDYTNLRCYTCNEKGHFLRDCPRNKGSSKANTKKASRSHCWRWWTCHEENKGGFLKWWGICTLI